MEVKKCHRCGVEKPLNDHHFHRSSYVRKDGTYGFVSSCKICRNRQNRQYCKKNYTRIKKNRAEYFKNYRRVNRKKIRNREKKWAKENPDKIDAIRLKCRKKGSKKLSDSYIKEIIIKYFELLYGFSLKRPNITNEMVEIKRMQIVSRRKRLKAKEVLKNVTTS